jgi:hypothetical protein
MSTERRRRSLWKRWILLGVALLLGIVGVRYLVLWSGDASHLQRVTADLDRDDPNWRLAEIEAHREEVPDEENGALVVAAVARDLPPGFPPTAVDELLLGQAQERQFHPTQTEALKKELAARAAVLAVARTLADRPRGRFPITYPRNPFAIGFQEQTNVRKVVILLRYDVLLRAQENDARGALRSCRGIVNGGRYLGEPFFIPQLIRMAVIAIGVSALERTLAQTEPEPDDLRAMQNLLADEEAFDCLKVSLRGERALAHEAFQKFGRGELNREDLPGSDPEKRSMFDRFFRGRWRSEDALMLELMIRRGKDADLPSHEQPAAEAASDAEVSKIAERAPAAKLPASSVSRIAAACRRKTTTARCARVACAAERYRRDRGTWPGTLGDLVPAYLTEIPLDPFNGKELRLERTAEGLIVSSASPMVTGRSFRLWDADKRRQPAVPPGKP